MTLRSVARSLSVLIDSGRISSVKELHREKIRLCGSLGLSDIPSNPDLLASLDFVSPRVLELLSIKPARAHSGISAVAVMVKPHECPGKCIYCPSGLGGKDTPKSYTGGEPSTMRGLMFKYSAFRQAQNRIAQFDAIGHRAEKIELIVMGGTFAAMPYSYQKNFIKRALDAITEKKNASLEAAKRAAEHSSRRLIGMTLETRPDYCLKKHVNRFLNFGATRVEVGVQLP
ncbi:MAG: tRNA uridine(34) 5-carboxymethylaminomethyl modification radical SAM/GNAT enzyme Elp3, partial [Candidatus Diapherotrites archaeon]|nr:tRNA uridine(34) 5-carboxymethylaminomethyl modification radical SAM/GNAT enzyme Elp3 [Candidatus Diapherotrites archaeon]